MADQPASASPKSGKADSAYNAADPNQIAKRKGDAALREKQRLNGLRTLMHQRDGRTWVRDLIERAHVFRTSFTGNSTTFFNEGERNQALQIMADLSAHCVPEMLVLFAEGADDAHGALTRALAILEGVTPHPIETDRDKRNVGTTETTD